KLRRRISPRLPGMDIRRSQQNMSRASDLPPPAAPPYSTSSSRAMRNACCFGVATSARSLIRALVAAVAVDIRRQALLQHHIKSRPIGARYFGLGAVGVFLGPGRFE